MPATQRSDQCQGGNQLSDRGHVFIVDDGSASADMLQELLKSNDYAVDRAAPDQDALRASLELELKEAVRVLGVHG